MSDNKKYYYLKLKDNFFDTDEIKILEDLDNGYLYSNILLKLYLKSLKNEGKLMFNDRIPYNPKMIATITNHNVDVVEKALNIFKQLELIEVLDNGAIYMLDIQNYIGKSTTEGDRKRLYRKKIESESNELIGQMSDIRPPEIEIEKEIKIEKDIELEISLKSKQTFDYQNIINRYNQICVSLPKAIQLTDKRKKVINSILKDYELNLVDTVFYNAENSDFLTGRQISKNTDHQNFKASFDWLLNKNNFIKVLENNYKNKERRKNIE